MKPASDKSVRLSGQPKPEPVVVRTVCSLCDEPWESLDCIRLLKMRPRTALYWSWSQHRGTYPVYSNLPAGVNLCGAAGATVGSAIPSTEYRTPEVV